MKRQLIAVGLAILLGLGGFTFIPEIVSATNLGDSNVFLTQQTSVTCTLASATMAVRRKALLAEDPQWSSITEESMRKIGWGAGLSHKFTYRTSRYAYTITHKNFDMNSGMTMAQKKEKIISLLNQHPEGLAIYARDGYNGFHQGNHCILLTRYEDGVFYCGDPASKKTKKEMPIKYARKVTIQNFASYWYVSHVEDLKNKGKTNLINAYAALNDASYIYDGTEKRPTATIMYKDKILTEGQDYTLEYEGDRIKAGNYKIIIHGINNYCGKITKSFKIKNRDINNADVTLSSTKFKYDGGLQTPGALVRYDREILHIGANYNVEYEDSVDIGKYAVTIYGTNDYDGEKKIVYYVLPDKVSNLSISNNTVSFSKVAGSPSYEIAYKKSGEDNWQTKKTDDLSYTLTVPGDYQIKVRAYKNDAYGSYSKTITAHIA